MRPGWSYRLKGRVGLRHVQGRSCLDWITRGLIIGRLPLSEERCLALSERRLLGLVEEWREGDSLDGKAHVGVGTQSYDNHDDRLRVDVDGREEANK